ncbi:MAG: glycosyltransferase family 4 protein [Chloroflexi bacterium]|nr:glycosyltransferase family 4 protein [Chloroflexota bacterium]
MERLDVVGYSKFYDGPPAPPLRRLQRGLKGLLNNRVTLVQEDNIRQISVRKLRLPGFLDALVQDVWVWLTLRAHLAAFYRLGIVYAPESALLARYLQRSGRIEHLIYHDIDYYPYVSNRHKRIVAWRERTVVRAADAVISVSRPLVGLRREQGAKTVVYLPNGVDFTHFHTAHNQRRTATPTLLYVGTLDRRWGVDLPILAMPLVLERLPEARLLIAGSGPAESELRALAAKQNVDHAVSFLGFVPYPELPDVMSRAEIGLATSRADIFRQYASPLKLVEYMAAGLPVICSGGGEAEMMIDESQAGITIPFAPEDFAEATCQLLTDRAKLAARRQAAIEYARSRSWEKLLQDFNAFAAQTWSPAGVESPALLTQS